MNPLDNINDNSINVIKTIVETHIEHQALIENGKSFPHSLPGILFPDLFSDGDCFLNILKGENNSLALEMVFPKIGEDELSTYEKLKKHEKFGGKKKYLFIEKLIYVMSLYDSGYIYFSEETVRKFPSFTTITEREEYYKKQNFNIMIWFITYPSLFKFVKKFYYANIIPSATLIDFYNNNYKTKEQLQYEKQVEISEEALRHAGEANRIAKKSNKIAIIVACISMLAAVLCAKFIDTTIDKKQHNELIETIKTQYNGQTTNEKR